MAVSLTRIQIRQELARLTEPLRDAEIDRLLTVATAQVTQWEAESPTGGLVTWTDFYRDRLALLDVQIRALSDRMASMVEREEDLMEQRPNGAGQTRHRRFVSRGLKDAYAALVAERKGILAKLGVQDADSYIKPPAAATVAVRGEEDDDLDLDWEDRVDTSAQPTLWTHR